MKEKKHNSFPEDTEELLSQVQRIAHIGNWNLEIPSRLLTWSEETYRIFGCSPKEFEPTYESLFELIHPDDRASVDEAYSKSIESKSAGYEIEHRIILPITGEIRHVHEKCIHVKDKGGNVVRSVGMVQDITEQKRTEEELKKSKQLLDATGRMAKVGGWELDAKTNQLKMTDEVYRIYGLPLDSELDLSEAIKFFHKDDRLLLENALREAIEEGKPYELDMRLTNSKGENLITRGMCKPIIENGKVVRLSGTFQDITGQVETQKHFEMLFEKMDTCVAIYKPLAGNRDFEFVDMNPAGLESSKLPREAIIGKKVTEVYPGVKELGVFAALQRVAKTGKPEFLPSAYYKDERIDLWVENHIFKLPSGLVVAAYEDITERKKIEEELVRSRKEFSDIFNMSLQLICIADINESKFLKVNPAFTTVLGYDESELVDHSFSEFTHPDDIEKTDKIVSDQLQKGKKVIGFTNRYRTKQGKWVWLEWTSHPVPEKGITYAIANDITEQKANENKLLQFNQRLSEAQKIASMGDWSWDAKNDKVEWSENLYSIMGLSPDKPPPNYAGQVALYHPDDRDIFEQTVAQCIENGESYSIELRRKRPDGKDIIVQAEGRAEIGKDGKVRKLFGTVQDITQRKLAEIELRESEEKLRNIFENGTNVFYSHTTDGIVNFISPQIKDLLGYTQEEAKKKWTVFCSDNPINKTGSEYTKKAIETGEPQPVYELEFVHKNGKKVLVEVRESPVVKDGKTIAIVGAFCDITQRKNNEQKIKRVTEELELAQKIAKIGNWFFDPAVGVPVWSDEVYRIYERDKELGPIPLAEYPEIYKGRWFEKFNTAITKAIKKGASYNLELLLQLPSGTEKWINAICVPLPEKGPKGHCLLGTIQDITERKRREQELKSRIKYEQIISEISTELSGLKIEEVDRAIDKTLSLICEFTESERAYIFQFKNNFSLVDNTHEYCAEGIEPQIQDLKDIDMEKELPWLYEIHRKGKSIIISDVKELPKEAHLERKHFEAQDIKSLMVFPIKSADKLIGFMGFDSVRKCRDWSEDNKSILKYCSEEIGHIIEWKRIQSELIHRENIFSQTFEQSSTATCFYDKEGTIFRVNDALCKMLGVKEKDILNANYNVFKDPSAIDGGIIPILKDVFDNKNSRNWEISFDISKSSTSQKTPTTKSGKIYLEVHAYPVISPKGRLEFVVFKHYDITQRKQTEKEIINLQRRNQALLDHSPACHKIIDLDFKLKYMNSNGFKMLKLEENDDLYGTTYPLDFFPEKSRNKLTDAMKKVISTGEKISFETAACNSEGNEIFLYHTIIPVKDGNGKVDYLTVVSADLTEQKEMQDRIRQSEKMDAIGQLAGGVAHDFNNQLSVVLGYADMLSQRLDDPNLKQFAESICTSARRSSELTSKLLAFSRKGLYQMLPTHIHKLIQDTVDMLQHSVVNKLISIKQELNAQESIVSCDSNSIQNVLLNVSLNACHAMPEGGDLTFNTDVIEVDDKFDKSVEMEIKKGKYIVISIKDTGSGIPEDVLPHIFEPFYTTKPAGKGTGMGLASVYGTIKQHKGSISVDSKIDKGTCFEIYLPLVENLNTESDDEISKKKLKDSLRILVVDDEEMVRDLGCEIFSSKGHSTLSAENGKEAVDIYRKKYKEIDLVVLDMMMPEMNGKDAFNEMKKINPDVKVILASGYSQDDDAKQLIAGGALGFVQKPFDIKQLIKAVNDAVN